MAELLYIDGSGTDLYGQSFFGQRITPDDSWTVESIWIDTMYVSVAGDAYCYIYADSGSGPTGSPIATSDANAVAGSPGGTETFTFSSPPTLSNGVPYWVVYHKAGAAIYGYRTTSNIYAGGNIGYTTHATDPTQSWNDNTGWDIRQFKVNGYTAPSSFTSVTSGEWDSPVTWGYAASATEWYPSKDGDDATISVDDTVTYSISADAKMGQIDIYGTLTFAPSANTQLIVGDSDRNTWLYSRGTGTLSIGTSAAPIHKDYKAKLHFEGLTTGAYGLQTPDGATVGIRGDPNYRGSLTFTKLASAGDGGNIITVFDDVSDWNIGDHLVINWGDRWSGNHITLPDLILTSVVGISGTLIECADAVDSSFLEGGVVAHMTSNVLIGQLNLDYDLWNYTASPNKPSWEGGGDSPHETNVDIRNAEFAGWNRIRYFGWDTGGPIFYDCNFRNALYALSGISDASLYNCNFNSHSATFTSLKNCYLENCVIIWTRNLNYNTGMYWKDCYILVNDGHFYNDANSRYEGCLINADGAGYNMVNCDFYDCAFTSVWGSPIGYSYDINYYNCDFGYDLDGRDIGVTTMFYMAYGYVNHVNCRYNYVTHSNYRNNKTYDNARFCIKDYDRVSGDDRIYLNKANIYVITADGSGDYPSQRVGGGSRIYEYDSDVYDKAQYTRDMIFEHKLYISNTNSKTIRYYLQTDFTDGLNVKQIELQATYPSSPTSSSVDYIVSTSIISTRSNQSDWSQYVELVIEPQNTGWIELSFRLGAYESGKKVWIDTKPEVT